jgi:mono/diheme cytochrome c family protein
MDGVVLFLVLFCLTTTGGALIVRNLTGRSHFAYCSPPARKRSARRKRVPAIMILAVSLIAAGKSVSAQTADPADVRAGALLFRQKADCQACHGWAADRLR